MNSRNSDSSHLINEDSGAVKTCALDVNGVPTAVCLAGNVSQSDCCIVVIPGNPGLAEFYEVFIERMYKTTNKNVSVVGISHAGHSPVWQYTADQTSYRKACGKNLSFQVDHKRQFLEEYIPKNTRIILVGHSIGCWVVLKLLESTAIATRVEKSVLLFPVIENIAHSPNGKFWRPLAFYGRYPMGFVAHLLSLAPAWVLHRFLTWRFKGRTVPDCLRRAGLGCFNYNFITNAMLMASHEFVEVSDLQPSMEEVIVKHSDDIMFYYGAVDRWAPRSFYFNMKERFPDADVRLCQQYYEHDFVLDSSDALGDLVLDYLADCDVVQRHNHEVPHISDNKSPQRPVPVSANSV